MCRGEKERFTERKAGKKEKKTTPTAGNSIKPLQKGLTLKKGSILTCRNATKERSYCVWQRTAEKEPRAATSNEPSLSEGAQAGGIKYRPQTDAVAHRQQTERGRRRLGVTDAMRRSSRRWGPREHRQASALRSVTTFVMNGSRDGGEKVEKPEGLLKRRRRAAQNH